MDKQIFFFLGKGGVGKTTLSAISANYFSYKKKNTGIYSFDSAHNLADVYEEKLSNSKKKINPYLSALEVDIKFWQTKYLAESKQNLQANYSYLSSYDFLKYFEVLNFAPDLDSTAMVLAFKSIIDKDSDEIVVVDMPPTALSMQFFDVVNRNLIWIKHLIKLRENIHDKKMIISKIKWGKNKIETDKILVRLNKLAEDYRLLDNILKESNYFVIQNPDNLSVLEANRVLDELNKKGFKKTNRLVNKVTHKQEIPFFLVQENSFRLINFEKMLEKNTNFFQFLDQMMV